MPAWLQWTLIGIGLVAIVLLAAFIIRQSRVIRRAQTLAATNKAFQDQRRAGMIESIQKMDQERFELERKHADAIRRAATAIRYHGFDQKMP